MFSLGILAVCALAAYSLMLAFTEDLSFKRWSLAHFLFTPSFIEHLPRPQMIGEAEYHHSSGDGPKPMSEGISFQSSASKSEILNQFDQYLSHRGYVRDSGSADFLDYQYSRGGDKFYFSIEPSNDGTNRVVAQECYFF